MTKTLEELKEKNINFWFRLVLRVMAWGTLMVMMIWKIWKPIFLDSCANGVHFNSVEKGIAIGSIALILSIEGIKHTIEQYMKRKNDARSFRP
ncbi:MAG: hypothetical protein AAF634_10505 [Bacteroidota bacterium]